MEVPRVDYEKLSDERLGEPSEDIQERVEAARQRQRERFAEAESEDPQDQETSESPLEVDTYSIWSNADMRPAEVRRFCQLDDTGMALIRAAMSQMQLTARAYHRVLKLARTIADLAGSEQIKPPHLAEALQYRPKASY